MATQFPFVIAESDSGKINQVDRELIRSRCMKGKNKRANSRRSLGAARRAARLSQRKQTDWSADDEAEGAAAHIPELGPSSNVNLECRLENLVSASGLTADPERYSGHLQSQYGPKLDQEITRFIHEDTPISPWGLVSASKSPKPAYTSSPI